MASALLDFFTCAVGCEAFASSMQCAQKESYVDINKIERWREHKSLRRHKLFLPRRKKKLYIDVDVKTTSPAKPQPGVLNTLFVSSETPSTHTMEEQIIWLRTLY